MQELPIKQFRLKHGYTFHEKISGSFKGSTNLIVGRHSDNEDIDAIFLGKVAEYDNMKMNVWLDTTGAHAVYLMGKRRSGKSFSLGCIAEGLCSSRWIKEGSSQQAVLVLDTMNVFLTMQYNIFDVYNQDSDEVKGIKQWGLESENLPLRYFYPQGTPAPPEGESTELSLKTGDLDGEDWASLFGVDTFSDPIGQLILEIYELVVIEGYEDRSQNDVSAKTNYF